MKKIQNTEYRKYRVYGTIGMIVLFLLGVIVGFILNGSDRINHSVMTKNQCEYLSVKMQRAIENNNYEEIGQLNKIYSENCLDRRFNTPKPHAKVEKSPETTCVAIEDLLLNRLNRYTDAESLEPSSHIYRAQIYANLSERGCSENSEKYKEEAKKELAIARALNDDNVENKYETTEIVETYKRLQMQAEAEKMIEKAKKLTNPAIDFIIQLEKIINED